MPSKKQDTSIVSVVHGICCGLDVHKKTVSACLVWSDARGTEECEVMEFETFTDDLVRLKEWLIERECPVVAMESTGQLDAGSQHIGRILPGYPGQCSAHEERTGSQD